MSKVVIYNQGNDSIQNQVETIYEKTVYCTPLAYSGSISRYKDTLRVKDPTESKYPHINLYKFNIPLSPDDKIITVSNSTRLDILADTYYNDATLWWIIAMASNISDPFNLSVGQLIRIPPINAIYETNSIFQRR